LPTGLELPKDANTQEGQFGTDDGRLSYVLKKAETTQYDLYVGRQDSLDKKIREISGTQDLQRRPRGVSAGVSVAFGF